MGKLKAKCAAHLPLLFSLSLFHDTGSRAECWWIIKREMHITLLLLEHVTVAGRQVVKQSKLVRRQNPDEDHTRNHILFLKAVSGPSFPSVVAFKSRSSHCTQPLKKTTPKIPGQWSGMQDENKDVHGMLAPVHWTVHAPPPLIPALCSVTRATTLKQRERKEINCSAVNCSQPGADITKGAAALLVNRISQGCCEAGTIYVP